MEKADLDDALKNRVLGIMSERKEDILGYGYNLSKLRRRGMY